MTDPNRTRRPPAAALAAGLLAAALLAGCSGETTRAFPNDSYPQECVTPTAPCPPGNE